MVGFGESWDEALFGSLEVTQPAKEAVPVAKKITPDKTTKEFIPEGSGGRALEENKKTQANLISDIEKISALPITIEEIKKRQDMLKKLKEDEVRIRVGGI